MSRTALVVGLGRSGRAAASLLRRRGWQVVAIDAGPVDAVRNELSALGVEVRAPWTQPVLDVDLVVKSPGVPREAPAVAAALGAGVPVWGELELAARELPNPIVGVTGTNGKTTTTELIAHVLRSAGRAAVACGNQGTPLSGLVDAIDPDAWLVVECSSFQLEDALTLHPRAAVLLNLAPDHLDRHGTLDAYRAAKLRLFAHQVPEDLALLPFPLQATGAAPTRRLVDGEPTTAAAAWSAGGLHVAGLGRIAGWDELPLRGRHNRENVMAAAAIVAHIGLNAGEIATGLASFAGVAHRLEVVADRAGVLFVNDSKGTNPDAVLAALDAYPRNVRLIAGGRGKGTSFAPVAAAARDAVIHAYLMGEAASELAAEFAAVGVAHSIHPLMRDALQAAAADARAGEVVLLSPACTSFDQFSSFEERGDAFRAAVHDLDDG